MKQTLVLLFWALAFSFSAAQNSLYFPPKTGSNWQTINPESLGFCSDRIDSLYQFLETRGSKSFVLLQDGKIVLEKYFGTFTQDSFWYWASAGKSATAFMIGQAQEEGLLDIHQPVSEYLGAGWTNCPPDKENQITVWHQLTMTNGLDDALPPTPSEPDPDNCTDPECLVYLADAGTRWAYHNAPYRLLHDVISAASGQTINGFTQTRLFAPTGMKGLWIDHILYGRARDMARFGLLTLAGGVWDGDTLLHDQQYMYDMTHRSQELNKSYGYLWWLNGQGSFMLPGLQLVIPFDLIPAAPDDMFAALGKNDQKIHVVPSRNWVVVRQGNAGGDQGPGGGQVPVSFDNDMWEYINALVCTPSAATDIRQTSATVQISPNPAGSHWNIRSEQALYRIELWDARGRLIRTQSPNGESSARIDAEDLAPGLYWLRVQHQTGSLTLKAFR